MLESRIGNEIKNIRLIARMSQSTLADKVGVSQALISEYELGKSSIQIDMLEKIMSAMDRKIIISLEKGGGKSLVKVDY